MNIDAVPSRGVVQEHVRDRADEFAVLENGTAAHSLHDPARFVYQRFVGYFDDVIFNVAGIMQKILEKIDYRATNKFREEIAKETSADYDREREKHLIILNAILEETKCIVKKDRGQDEILDFTEPLIEYKALSTDKYYKALRLLLK